MVYPFRFRRSRLPFPIETKYKPMALTWKNSTIVFSEGAQLVAYIHSAGKWTRNETSGTSPQDFIVCTAHVINDKMYVIDAPMGPDATLIYSLDLNNWTWNILNPSGTPPSGHFGLSSWVYQGNIYCFCWRNGLFCYNILNNSWEWPKHKGDVPSPRIYQSTVILDDTVFLFGGRTENVVHCNDLYTFNMVNMLWERVHNDTSKSVVPSMARHIYSYGTVIYRSTLTIISESIAVLINPCKETSTCWTLNLQKAKQLMDPSSIWTKVRDDLPAGFDHTTLLEPMSKNLWILGYLAEGVKGCETISNVLKIPTTQPTLQDIAIDLAARTICPHDPKLKLPGRLRKEIEDHSNDIGVECLCSKNKYEPGMIAPKAKRRRK